MKNLARFAAFILCLAILSGCEDDKKATPSDNTCSIVGTQCADSYTLIRCTDGKMIAENCPNGCEFGACKTNGSTQSQCTFTNLQCSTDFSSVIQCINGSVITVETCATGCELGACKSTDGTQTCGYTGNVCNNGSVFRCDNGTQVLVETCANGCKNNSCIPDPDAPDDTCNWQGRRCNASAFAIECQNGTETVVEYCEQDCQDGICTDWELEEGCTYQGSQCKDGHVVACDIESGNEYVADRCIEGCVNGACRTVSCPDNLTPSCFDLNTTLECNQATGELQKVACPNDKLCVNGTCVASSAESDCNFETSCSQDRTSIRKCESGKASYVACGQQMYCDDSDGTPKCVSAVTDGRCDEAVFIPYCADDKTLVSCDQQAIQRENCNGKQCVNGRCIDKNTAQIGDKCTVETFSESCIGNVPVTCTNKKVTAKAADCSKDNMICGVVTENSIASAFCFEPCKVKGQHIDQCITFSETAYQSTYECIAIDADNGDGRLGLEMVQGSFQMCDISCEAGKCVDYTEGISDAGKSCDPASYKAYCKDSTRAVTCDYDSKSKADLVTVEKCDYNESCQPTTIDGVATVDCIQSCKASDPPKYECSSNSWGFTTSNKFECKQSNGTYLYLHTDTDICDTNKGCAEDGQCAK
ncbi:MAG: hypothetical protein IKY83_03350 [Proteobacteria bacterium]|nr:hypothetical protein [Pseudomonadota bacterium]